MVASMGLGHVGLGAPSPVRVKDIMGVSVVASRGEAAIEMLDRRLDRGERTKLAYLNAHGSNLAATSEAFRAALSDFVILNDGIGVDIAARVLDGEAFPENLNGTDFTPRYFERTRHAFKVYLLGAAPGIAERARDVFASIAPRHAYVGARDGYFAEGEVPAVLAAVRASEADLVLVALGNPAQEMFIARHFDALGCRMAVAVGGLFDFVAGEKPRAPLALRRAGLEWAFRLSLEPGRMWKRYILGNPRFLARVASHRIARKLDRVRGR